MTNPWVGLRPFTTAEGSLFFGREREIQILQNLVETLPFLILYAPSGTGKSSLINAGLGPVLTADPRHVPVFVGTGDDPLGCVSSALRDSGWAPPPGLDLVDLVEQHWLARDHRVIVFIDQFEERLNAGTPVEDVFAAISKMAHQSTDSACIVLCLREDYLGSLEPLMRRVPGLLNGSYRVPPLTRTALERAVHGPLAEAGSGASVRPELVSHVLDDLRPPSSQQEPGEQRFEAGYFQIVWSTLWENSPGGDARTLELPTYERLGRAEQILRDFTSGILNSLEPVEAELFWAMSRYLVLPTGAKVALTVEDLEQLIRPSDYLRTYPWSDPVLFGDSGRPWLRAVIDSQGMTSLIRRVFQRLTASDAPIFQRVIRFGREEYELLHDLLGKILLDWRREYEAATKARSAEASRRMAADTDRLSRAYGLNRYEDDDQRMQDLVRFTAESIQKLKDYLERLRSPHESIGISLPAELDDLLPVKALSRAISGSMLYESHYTSIREALKHMPSYEDLLNNTGIEILRLGLAHPDKEVRREFQERAYIWSHGGMDIRLQRDPAPRPSHLPMYLWKGTVATAAVVSSLAVSYLTLGPLYDRLGVTYGPLTLGHVGLILIAAYLAVLFDEDDIRVKDLGIALFPAATRWEDGPKWVLAGVPFTWPVPAFLISLFGLGMAWVFLQFGWGATPGFNVGIELAVIGAAVGFLFWFDD